MNLGIDYGAVNVKTSECVVFQTKTKKAESIIGKEEYIQIDDKKHIFGLGEYQLESDVKFKQKHFLPLLFASICKSTTDINNKIMIGLPISHYKKYKEELKEFIMQNNKKEVIFKANGKDEVTRQVVIDEVDVFPEGLAVLYSLTQEELDKFNNRDILIVDIGGSTVDIALLEGNGLNREVARTHSVPTGMHTVFDDIKNYIVENTEDEKITLEKCQRILEGTYIHSVNGLDTNTNFIKEILLNVTIKILKDMKMKFGNDLKSANMLVCGGGAKYIYPYLKEIQPNAVKVESIFANAKGYKRVGEFKWFK